MYLLTLGDFVVAKSKTAQNWVKVHCVHTYKPHNEIELSDNT